jgi:hypothetical protein
MWGLLKMSRWMLTKYIMYKALQQSYNSTMALHIYILPVGWAIGLLVAAVGRHSLTPSTTTTTTFRVVFWDILLCKIIADDGGSTHLWNVGRQSFYTAVYPRRQLWTSYSPLWELEISQQPLPLHFSHIYIDINLTDPLSVSINCSSYEFSQFINSLQNILSQYLMLTLNYSVYKYVRVLSDWH